MIRTLCKTGLALGFLMLPLVPTSAAVVKVEGVTVTKTLAATDDRYGGCMAELSVSLAAQGLRCPNPASRWVTFSCTGTHTSKSSAMRMLDSAQLAFAMGKTVDVWVDDEKSHNGHCFAERIDVHSS